MEELNYKTGTLVEFRSRPWVVQQSIDTDLLVLKPLGGTDAETIGLYKPVYGHALKDAVKPYNFRKPSKEDIGKNSYPGAARILFNACRLSFRDIAGPFQCLGRLSFEPRPYQMVPLILALKHETIRLLISDDVGIGKTLESLLIAKELLDRKEIQRFAVICLPHLCEQWQNEIRDKFGLEAEIIRSSTISRLEKTCVPIRTSSMTFPFRLSPSTTSSHPTASRCSYSTVRSLLSWMRRTPAPNQRVLIKVSNFVTPCCQTSPKQTGTLLC